MSEATQLIDGSTPVLHFIEIPVASMGMIIGPAGATISNIRDTFNVNINIPRKRVESKIHQGGRKNKAQTGQEENVYIKIRGSPCAVARAEAAVKGLVHLDQCMHSANNHKHQVIFNIPREYHAELIGQGGRFAQRVEKRYGVRVLFGGSSYLLDTTSETWPKDSDTILIIGNEDSIRQAQEELWEGYQCIRELRTQRSVKPSLLWVFSEAVGAIIGREGRMIRSIQIETGTDIRIHTDEAWASGVTTISLYGDPTGIATAMSRIRDIETKVGCDDPVCTKQDVNYDRDTIDTKKKAVRKADTPEGGPENTPSQNRPEISLQTVAAFRLITYEISPDEFNVIFYKEWW